jgi:hypothetical protein
VAAVARVSTGTQDLARLRDEASPMTRQMSAARRAVIGWNLLPLAAIVAGVLIGATDPDDKGGWAMMFAVFLGLVGGAALIMSTALGLFIAQRLVRRSDARSPRSDTFGIGTLSAFLGWLITVLAVRVVAIRATVG